MISSKVFKEVTYPQSAMQCCQICMNEMACDGVKFDGTTCSALRNVKINHGSSAGSSESVDDGEVWVDAEVVQPKLKTKLLVMNGIDPTPEDNIKKTEIIDLEDPDNHCTSIDFPHVMTYTAGALLGTDLFTISAVCLQFHMFDYLFVYFLTAVCLHLLAVCLLLSAVCLHLSAGYLLFDSCLFTFVSCLLLLFTFDSCLFTFISYPFTFVSCLFTLDSFLVYFISCLFTFRS